VAFFLPANIALLQGQDSIVLLLLFTLGFLQLSEGHDTNAGCIFALATFKPHLVLPLLLIMLAARRWKVVGSFFATCLALVAASVLLVGWRTAFAFPRFLLEFSRLPAAIAGAYPEAMPNIRGLVSAVSNGNISSLVTRLIVIGISLLVMLLVVFACARDQGWISEINFSLAVVASLLIGYHVNGHDLTLLLLPMFLVANYVAGHELTTARALLAMAVGLVFIVPSLVLPPPVTVASLLFFLALLLRESLLRPVAFTILPPLPKLRALEVSMPNSPIKL
jgi:hypothetical protein